MSDLGSRSMGTGKDERRFQLRPPIIPLRRLILGRQKWRQLESGRPEDAERPDAVCACSGKLVKQSEIDSATGVFTSYLLDGYSQDE